MRVVLLNQYYAPDEAATAQLLTDVGQGLAAAGHQVNAVCSRRAYFDPAVQYPSREAIAGVSVRRIRTTGLGRSSRVGRLLDYVTFLAGASRALLFLPRPDVIVSLSTPPMVALLGWGAARLRRARSCYWVMDVYPELAFELGVLRPGTLAGRTFSWLSRFVLRRSDRVIALGDTMARRLETAGARSVSVVHNWADGEAIRPRDVADHPLRSAWGWQDRFVVLYSGNMGLAHEFDTVLRAAELLRDHRRVLFAFVGGGPRRAEVEAAARRLALDNVQFRPYVPRRDLGLSLTAGDVHLITLRGGMPGLLVPSKIYGILAAGRPSVYVGPDAGEIAEILRIGDCGQRIPPGDAEGLVDAVQRYERDPARRQGEGARARQLFEERFTLDRALEAFARLVETRH